MKFFLVYTAILGTFALAACGGKVFVDLPDGEGGSSGSVNVGGGSPCTNVTCAEAILETTIDFGGLCGVSGVIYGALIDCVCGGACAEECDANICVGGAVGPDCQACVVDMSANGCGTELTQCNNDV